MAWTLENSGMSTVSIILRYEWDAVCARELRNVVVASWLRVEGGLTRRMRASSYDLPALVSTRCTSHVMDGTCRQGVMMLLFGPLLRIYCILQKEIGAEMLLGSSEAPGIDNWIVKIPISG